MRQCLLSNGILLSDEELYALEERFNDDMGFNYYWFMKEAEPKPYEEPLVLKENCSTVLTCYYILFFSMLDLWQICRS